MKVKSMICSLMIMCMGVLFLGFSTKAYTNGSVQAGHDLDISLSGFVAFVKGVDAVFWPDDVTYTVNMSGNDTYLVNRDALDIRVYIDVGTDHKTTGALYFFFPEDKKEGTNEKFGYGEQKAC